MKTGEFLSSTLWRFIDILSTSFTVPLQLKKLDKDQTSKHKVDNQKEMEEEKTIKIKIFCIEFDRSFKLILLQMKKRSLMEEEYA